MKDILSSVRRALTLLPKGARRRLALLAFANVFVAGLDMLGILLLVPLLAFLGPGGQPQGIFVSATREILGTANPETIVLALALLATVLFVVKGVSAVFLLWIQTGVLNRAQVSLSERILESFVKAPWLVQLDSSTGGIIRTSIGSVSSVAQTVASGISILAESAVFVAVFAALVIVNPVLAFASVAYLAFSGLVYLRIVRRPIEKRGQQVQVEGEKMNASLINLVGGIKELTVRNSSSAYIGRYEVAANRYLDATRLVNVTNQGMRYLLEMLMIAGVALVIGFATLSGSATATVLVSIGVLLASGLRLIPSLNTLLIGVNTIRSTQPGVAIVEDELARFGGYGYGAKGDGLPPATGFSPTGAFAFRDVGFRYPTRSEDAISGISVEVGFGEALGIVGSTGSGKSTLIDLLLGLLEPESGEILIDGKPLVDNLRSWRAELGFVPQDIFLVDDTLAANITFGEIGEVASASKLKEAVRLAHLEDVVNELPDGLDTMLGERGVRLSGGQRQRVGLARALYRKPSILILDEATSALDNETERKISEAIQSLHGKLTTVIVAHRLSTVRSCDRILFLERGRVSGIGTFDELDRENEGFSRLVELGSLRGSF
ncbi:MAG: ABC transporter ATP-binding protein/permease [Acidobacteria bacterium]|nr:ABC transporter ATP-binding protein/permease [Acidobacteriota bacterium]